jgi:hypothetical protein
MQSEKNKMLADDVYLRGNAEIHSDQADTKAWLVRQNAALGLSPEARRTLLLRSQ